MEFKNANEWIIFFQKPDVQLLPCYKSVERLICKARFAQWKQNDVFRKTVYWSIWVQCLCKKEETKVAFWLTSLQLSRSELLIFLQKAHQWALVCVLRFFVCTPWAFSVKGGHSFSKGHISQKVNSHCSSSPNNYILKSHYLQLFYIDIN